MRSRLTTLLTVGFLALGTGGALATFGGGDFGFGGDNGGSASFHQYRCVPHNSIHCKEVREEERKEREELREKERKERQELREKQRKERQELREKQRKEREERLEKERKEREEREERERKEREERENGHHHHHHHHHH